METQDGRTFIVIHEANLVDYARMFPERSPACRVARCAWRWAPYADGIKGARGARRSWTPWRTIQFGRTARDRFGAVRARP